MRPSVVVTGPRRSALGTLPERLRRRWSAVDVDVVVPVEACARRVAAVGVRLLVDCIEAPWDLAPLRELRRGHPELPIVVAGSRLQPASERPLLPDGPTTWAPSLRNTEAIARYLERILGLQKAVDEGRARIAQSRALARETRGLLEEHQRLQVAVARNLNRSVRPRFAPLLVESDPAQALRFVQAFAQVHAPPPAAVVASAADAIDYLSGKGAYQDRSTWPAPTLVLLDFHLADRSGLDVLAWIRKAPSTQGLPVVVLGRGMSAEDVVGAYARRANSVLAKPDSLEGAVEMARALHYYWTRVNIVAGGPEPR